MAREHAATFEDVYLDAPDHPMFEKARKAAERAREPMVSLEHAVGRVAGSCYFDIAVPPPTADGGVCRVGDEHVVVSP